MLLPLLIAIIGVALVIVGIVTRRSLRPRQDRIIRTGGFSVDQIKVVRRAIIRGRFPDDPALREVTIAYARQGATNLPLGFRSTPLILGGLVLAMSLLYAIPGQALLGVTFQALYALLAIYMVVQSARALRGCRRVLLLAESPRSTEPTPEPTPLPSTQPGVPGPS